MTRAHTVDAALVQSLASALVRRAEERQRRLDERKRTLREAAQRLARVLVADGATRVWLVGSLAGQGGVVHERSDIDLAVEGLANSDEWSLAGRLEVLAGVDVDVDVILLERAPASFRDTIATDGELLDVAPS